MTETRYRKGDRFAVQTVQGVVVEDIGPIGVGGRRLYRVEFQFGLEVEEPMQIELPAANLRKIEVAAIA